MKKCINCAKFLSCDYTSGEMVCDDFIKADRVIRKLALEDDEEIEINIIWRKRTNEDR